MPRIGFSVGHGTKLSGGEIINDPGAVNDTYGITEHETCHRILNTLEELLSEQEEIELVIAPVGETFQQRVEYLNDYHANSGEIDISIELHLNGYHDSSINRTECLYYPTSDVGKSWAQKLQDVLVDSLGFQDKEIIERPDLYFLRKTSMPAVMVEPWFITNDECAREAEEGDLIQRTADSLFIGLVE